MRIVIFLVSPSDGSSWDSHSAFKTVVTNECSHLYLLLGSKPQWTDEMLLECHTSDTSPFSRPILRILLRWWWKNTIYCEWYHSMVSLNSEITNCHSKPQPYVMLAYFSSCHSPYFSAGATGLRLNWCRQAAVAPYKIHAHNQIYISDMTNFVCHPSSGTPLSNLVVSNLAMHHFKDLWSCYRFQLIILLVNWGRSSSQSKWFLKGKNDK